MSFLGFAFLRVRLSCHRTRHRSTQSQAQNTRPPNCKHQWAILCRYNRFGRPTNWLITFISGGVVVTHARADLRNQARSRFSQTFRAVCEAINDSIVRVIMELYRSHHLSHPIWQYSEVFWHCTGCQNIISTPTRNLSDWSTTKP